MESLKALKDELINQKRVIEGKSGVVFTAHENPSPYEITEGIKSIPSSDLSDATATEADVTLGKTFYAGNSILKTGTGNFDPDAINMLFLYNTGIKASDKICTCIMPEDLKNVRSYLFYQNYNTFRVRLNESLTEISDYSFYEARGAIIENLEELQYLKKIGNYAFANAKSIGVDIGHLPHSIATLSSTCMFNTSTDCFDYRFPNNLKSLAQSVFRHEYRLISGNLDLSNFNLNILPGYTFYYHAFGCDLNVPDCVQTIGQNFNYNGSFRNIKICSAVTEIGNNAFGANTTNALDTFYLRSVTFEGEIPPAKMGVSFIANQHVQNGVKIYVPDNAVEEYKAVANLSQYSNIIFPISQKD